ncbi:uncharacterized protein LOC110450386 [Mizuhopecten yessoensis]|uniref:uncharacterized protein LOC110450386 n=1 Tax=Mizuhopecten yessoensis TaxID=6573 RepID=UPI000B45D3DF|nr:uncharacterized protein LOC110450386 [Mizuhopecten yessoensis]
MMRTVSFLIPFYGTFFVAFSSSSLNFRNLFNESVPNNSFYDKIVGIRPFIKEATLDRLRKKICVYVNCERNVPFSAKNVTDRVRIIKPAPTCKVEGTILSEPSELTNDTTCMKFKIPAHIAHNSLAINKADLFIHIKKKGKRKARNSRKSRKNRRITLKISDFTVEAGRGKKINARFKFRPSETKFYRVALPVSYLTEIKKSSARNLHLCITCIKCNRKTAITFPLKKKVFRAPKRKMKLKKNRPYLIIKAKKPFKKRTKRGKSVEDSDCLQQKFMRFSQIGLGKVILRPRGFYVTTCSRTCISNGVELPEMQSGVGISNKRRSKSHVIRKKDISVSQNSTNMDIVIKRKILLNSFHSCRPSGYEHRQFVAVKDDLTLSKINVRIQNADVQRCNCQRLCV